MILQLIKRKKLLELSGNEYSPDSAFGHHGPDRLNAKPRVKRTIIQEDEILKDNEGGNDNVNDDDFDLEKK